MPAGRKNLATAVVDGKIYAIGGFVGNGIYLSTVEVYTPATDRWQRAASMPTARDYLVTAVVERKTYAIGGCGGPTTVEVYNPATNSWRKMANLLNWRNFPTAAVVVDGKIYVIGGNIGSTDTVKVYDPATDKWQNVTEVPKQVYDSASMVSDGVNPSTAVIVGGKKYIITEYTLGWISPPTLKEIIPPRNSRIVLSNRFTIDNRPYAATISTQPSLFADGESTAEIIVTLTDRKSGNPATNENVILSTTLGQITTPATHRGNGVYVGIFTAGTRVGQAKIYVSVNGVKIEDTTLTLVEPLPEISLSHSSIDFGEIEVGTSAERTVQIDNIGIVGLKIQSINLSGGKASPFEILPLVQDDIPPGQNRVMTIAFTPSTDGAFSAEIVITSNDPNTPTKTIHVTGSSVYVWSPTHPDESLWYQNPNPIFRWSGIPEAVGYYALLDEHPNTVPTIDNGDFLFRTEIDYPNTPDGVWYFHVSPELEKGNAPVYHRQIRIDTKPPVIKSSTHPNQNLWSNRTSAMPSWKVEHPPKR